MTSSKMMKPHSQSLHSIKEFCWGHQMNIRRLYPGSAPKVGKVCINYLPLKEYTLTSPCCNCKSEQFPSLSWILSAPLPPPWHSQYSPEPLSLVVEGARVSAIGGLVELRQKGLAGLLAGVVGKLDRNGLSGTWWLLSIQALDGLFSFYPLIKADEAHTSGATCGASRSQTNRVPFTSQSLDSHSYSVHIYYVYMYVCM